MNVYEKIVELCQERGIAVTALEQELGFSRGSIGKMRYAKRPNAERLRRIAEFFNVPVSYLFGGGPIMQAGNKILQVHPIPKSQKPEYDSPYDIFAGEGGFYYMDKQTAALAQELFENEDRRILMDASRGLKPEKLQLLAKLAKEMQDTNPNG